MKALKALDWLRDALFDRHATQGVKLRRVKDMASPEARDFYDPSGRHDFGRRAHRPDPKARYGFDAPPS
jgi:hypothetical protein